MPGTCGPEDGDPGAVEGAVVRPVAGAVETVAEGAVPVSTGVPEPPELHPPSSRARIATVIPVRVLMMFLPDSGWLVRHPTSSSPSG
jgi:hypothetical protein